MKRKPKRNMRPQINEYMTQGYTYSQARYRADKDYNGEEMTKKWKAITKEQLIACGITNVTKDGHVYAGDYELAQYKYGNYMNVSVRGKYIGCDKEWKALGVHRIVWIWFNGVQPANMVVDHIDNNRLNNNLDNLQLLTFADNLRKNKSRVGTNQYIKQMTEEQYQNYLKEKEELAKKRLVKKNEAREKKLKKALESLESLERAYTIKHHIEYINKWRTLYKETGDKKYHDYWKRQIASLKKFKEEHPKKHK